MEVTLQLIVEGGHATAGKPLGPLLYPYGIDLNKAVEDINSLTSDYKGLKTKIQICVNTKSRNYKIMLVKPKSSDLIKQHSIKNIITKANLEKVATMLSNTDIPIKVKELEGTCKSMHIQII